MSIDTMSHEQATTSQAAERYALGKLGPEEREAFESHYFDCPDCFEQVRLEMHFRRHAKEVLGPGLEQERGWLERMLVDMRRPAPVFASVLLLCFAGGMGAYQRNEIAGQRSEIAGQRSEIANLKWPRIQPKPVLLTGASKSGPGEVIRVKRKSALSLRLEFDRAPEFISYQTKIVEAESGKVKFSLQIPTSSVDAEEKDRVTVFIPVADSLDAGSYVMNVYGEAADGGLKQVKRSRFELEFQD